MTMTNPDPETQAPLPEPSPRERLRGQLMLEIAQIADRLIEEAPRLRHLSFIAIPFSENIDGLPPPAVLGACVGDMSIIPQALQVLAQNAGAEYADWQAAQPHNPADDLLLPPGMTAKSKLIV